MLFSKKNTLHKFSTTHKSLYFISDDDSSVFTYAYLARDHSQPCLNTHRVPYAYSHTHIHNTMNEWTCVAVDSKKHVSHFLCSGDGRGSFAHLRLQWGPPPLVGWWTIIVEGKTFIGNDSGVTLEAMTLSQLGHSIETTRQRVPVRSR